MSEPFKLGEIRGEVKAISCLKSFNPETAYATNSLPVRSELGYFGVSVKKDDQPTTHTKRQHAFKKIWERNVDEKPHLVGMRASGQDSYAVNWKHWPPPIPEIVPGLKIPVEMVPQVDYRLSQTGLWREVQSGTEAKPLDPETSDFFQNMSGSLNTPQAQWFSISPPSLLFLNSKMGEYYQVTLKLRNIGHIPRRIRVIPPYSKSFQILWGSDLDEKTLISPGLTTRVVVQFKPANNNAINDLLMVIIDGDGALIVPMMSASATPPIIETTEWDCGCSSVGNERIKCFDIKNVGGDARFWILSEEEFRKEYLAVFREFERQKAKKYSESCKIKTKFKLDQLYLHCFRIFPSCFRLQRNQKIEIKVKYNPRDANFHYEKLAILCDNGEIRWIAVRGMGLDTKSPGILELKGDWSAPPCDLPSDINANYIIDCGDLIPGEMSTLQFTITNKSCLSMYFFWCLRPIQGVDGALQSHTSKNMLQHQIEGSLQVEWEDYDTKINNSRPTTPSNQIRIFPAQGTIEGNQEVVCTLMVDCPHGTGYHSGILSIFVEQVNETAKAMIIPIITELEENNQNDIPMYYEDLIQTMPEISHLKKKKEDLYNHFHPRRNKDSTEMATDQVENKKIDIQGQFKNLKLQYQEHKIKHKKKSGDMNIFDEEENPMPIYLMKRKNTQDGTFQLTQLDMPVAGKDNKGNLNGETDEGKECKEGENLKPKEDEDLSPAKNPLNLYQKLMERQQKLEELKKTGNFQHFEEFMSEKAEGKVSAETEEHDDVIENSQAVIENNPVVNESNLLETENKHDGTEDNNARGHEEGDTKDTIERKSPRSHGVDSMMATVSKRGSVGGITEEMSDFIRQSIITGPKMWLKDSSALMPVREIEIWMRSIPLQSWFYPPFIIATGTSGWVIERAIQFHNQSKYPIEVEWEKIIDDICCISCDPQVIVVNSLERASFRVKIQFQKFGKMHGKLNGTMRLPFSVCSCSISLDIKTTSPAVEILTPLLSFGLLTFGTEKVKSLAIKNTGIKRAKWRARLAEDALENEENEIIAKHQTKIVSGQLLRVWPQWGVLDPGEVAGAQVYLSAEVHGRVATSIEIVIDENPNLTTYVTVCAEVQTPVLFFESGFFAIPEDIFQTQSSYTSVVKINNPTGFYLAFSWQCPIGRQSKSCKVEIEPTVGFVAPKASTECRVSVTNPENTAIHNLFVPCCVEGMKEPLILKLFSSNS